jgi:hypothetical protein
LRCRSLLRRSQVEQELADELRLERQVEEKAGTPPTLSRIAVVAPIADRKGPPSSSTRQWPKYGSFCRVIKKEPGPPIAMASPHFAARIICEDSEDN